MRKLESYKDSIMDEIVRQCIPLSSDDLEPIGEIVLNVITQLKTDLVDEISRDCIDGVKFRLEQTLGDIRRSS